MRERNEDGFTLIEIIVSTAIGMVVLAVALSMILTSFDTFGTFSTTGLKKESLDNLVDYVRNEVMNATEVVMSDSTPNPTDSKDWHWLAVKNGQLYYGDNDKNTSGKLVVNSSYYKQKSSYDRYQQDSQMTWSGTCSQTKKNDDYVYIVNFSYKLSYQGTSYSKSDAINFSNVKHEEDSDIKNSGDIRLLSKKNSVKNLDDNNLKLWYRKETSSSNNNNNKVDSKLSHTVADKIYYMSSYSDRGYFTGTCESIQDNSMFTLPMYNDYRAGDYVYYEGYWWMVVKNLSFKEVTNNKPGTGGRLWQRLSEEFSSTSVYFKGDVIKYNGGYYQRQISEVINNDPNPPEPYNTDKYPNAPYQNSSSTWKYIGKTVDDSIQGFDMDYSEVENGKLTTVMKYQAPSSSPINDSARTSLGTYSLEGENISYTNAYLYATDFPTVEEYNTEKSYKIGDLVKVAISGSDGNRGSQYKYYQLYKKIAEPEKKATANEKKPGSSFKSGWELLENEYSPASSYEVGKEMRIGNNDLDKAVNGTSIDYIKLNSVSGEVSYKDTNNNNQTYRLNQLKNICSTEASLYFGLKYGYIKSVTNNNGEIDFNYYRGWAGKTSEQWLDRGMIYYNSRKGSDSDNISYDDGNVKGTTQNSEVRKELWTELTYNDIVKEG